jgi:hypothetical protein
LCAASGFISIFDSLILFTGRFLFIYVSNTSDKFSYFLWVNEGEVIKGVASIAVFFIAYFLIY